MEENNASISDINTQLSVETRKDVIAAARQAAKNYLADKEDGKKTYNFEISKFAQSYKDLIVVTPGRATTNSNGVKVSVADVNSNVATYTIAVDAEENTLYFNVKIVQTTQNHTVVYDDNYNPSIDEGKRVSQKDHTYIFTKAAAATGYNYILIEEDTSTNDAGNTTTGKNYMIFDSYNDYSDAIEEVTASLYEIVESQFFETFARNINDTADLSQQLALLTYTVDGDKKTISANNETFIINTASENESIIDFTSKLESNYVNGKITDASSTLIMSEENDTAMGVTTKITVKDGATINVPENYTSTYSRSDIEVKYLPDTNIFSTSTDLTKK